MQFLCRFFIPGRFGRASSHGFPGSSPGTSQRTKKLHEPKRVNAIKVNSLVKGYVTVTQLLPNITPLPFIFIFI